MFDSFIHSLAHIYIENTGMGRGRFDEVIQKSSAADLFRFAAVLSEMGAGSRAYRWRTDILTNYHESTTQAGISVVLCCCAVRDFLKTHISLVLPTVTSSLSCSCKKGNNTYTTLPINDAELLKSEIRKLQDVILSTEHKDFSEVDETCRNCKKAVKRMYTIDDIVMIYVKPDKLVNHHEIPTEIVLSKQRFALRSSVDEIPKKTEHVASNCLRSNGKWYLYDDDKEAVIESSRKVYPRVLFYERKSSA